MKPIEQLEQELKLAKQKNLIVSYEHIMHRDYLLIQLHEDCSERTKIMLKKYIQQNFRQISCVIATDNPNKSLIYIKYNDDCC